MNISKRLVDLAKKLALGVEGVNEICSYKSLPDHHLPFLRVAQEIQDSQGFLISPEKKLSIKLLNSIKLGINHILEQTYVLLLHISRINTEIYSAQEN